MSVSEIDDVDVVAQARAVRRRIVIAEDRDVIALAERDLQDQWDEVRLRVVVLADGAIVECTGCVEVAQRDVADAVRAADPLHHLLHRALRLAVRVRRLRRIVFHDRHALRLAVDSSRRREDDLIDVVAYHRLEQHLHAVDVVVEVLQGFLDALTDEGVRCEVDDRLDVVLRENLVENGCVADVALVELRLRIQGIAMTRLQIVDDDNVFALRHELMDCMRTDITSAATNQNRHM